MTEAIRAEECDWATDFKEKDRKPNTNKGQGDRKKMEWMKFDHPGSYVVRLVGKRVMFKKYYKPFGKGTRIITHDNYKDEDPARLAGFYPNNTFAVHIIDRADGHLKILEKGNGLFKYFSEFQQLNNINPGDLKEAPDWSIKVEWPNGKKDKAKYSATATVKMNAITEEERKMIQDTFTEGDIKAAKDAAAKANEKPNPLLYRLSRIYQTTELAKIKEAWNNLPESAKIPTRDDDGNRAETSEAPPRIEEPTPPVTVEDPDASDAPDADDAPATGADDKKLFPDNDDMPF